MKYFGKKVLKANVNVTACNFPSLYIKRDQYNSGGVVQKVMMPL